MFLQIAVAGIAVTEPRGRPRKISIFLVRCANPISMSKSVTAWRSIAAMRP